MHDPVRKIDELRKRQPNMPKTSPSRTSTSTDLLAHLERIEVAEPATTSAPATNPAWLLRAHLPTRHASRRELTGDRWIKVRQHVWKRVCDGGALVVLCGPRGTGKTQLAVEVVRAFLGTLAPAMAVQMGRRFPDPPALYTTAAEMFRAIRTGMLGDEGERVAVSAFTRPLLLVIDEAHERGNTDYEDRTMTQIVDARYREMRNTIILSNETGEALASSLGKSIISRATECGGVIVADWVSFRGVG